MGEQQTFAGLAWSGKKKQTRRELFLAEMNAVLPWTELRALVAPHYPTGAGGRRAMPLETMLRIYFLQHWYDLSDPAAEDALYDSEAMRRFAGVELGEDTVPDETTILHFRHLLERHRLTEAMFDLVRRLLEGRGLLLKSGTVVDATILHAPSSTKNAADTRDPEMKQGRKGKTWYFGMKVHTGSDRRGIVHSLTTTHAGEADITQLPQLLHGEERELYGDQAYWAEADRQAAEAAGIRPRQPTPDGEAPVERAVETDQPGALADPRPGRARVSRREAPLGLYQGPLPRVGEEHGARLRGVRAGEPVPPAPPAAACGGDVSPLTPPGRADERLTPLHPPFGDHVAVRGRSRARPHR
jgi:transposase, IS5 family